MKKLLFGLIATIMFGFVGNAQTTNEQWLKMMEKYRTSLDFILKKECPSSLQLSEFKISVINGELPISESLKKEIDLILKPLKTYGKEFADKHKLESEDENNLVFYASFSPNYDINDGNLILEMEKLNNYSMKLNCSEVGMCALSALGADAAYAWAAGTGTSWSMAAFSYCLYGEYND